MGYVLTPLADRDLDDLGEYLDRLSPDAAARVLERLEKAMEKLAEMPGIGHRREDLTSYDLRFWSVYSYLIIYRPGTSPLEIVRVLHSARDLPRLLEEAK